MWKRPISSSPTESTQDESRATYEGWVREAESHINWANHVDFVYDLIRGCNPAPGAWTEYGVRKLYLFDARKIVAGTFGMVRGHKLGEVVSVGEQGMRLLAQGGFVEVSRVTPGRRSEDSNNRSWHPAGNNSRSIGGDVLEH